MMDKLNNKWVFLGAGLVVGLGAGYLLFAPKTQPPPAP